MNKYVCDECLTAQERAILIYSIYRAKDKILGENFYCVDPMGGVQCCEYFLEEIVKNYNMLKRRTAPWYVRFCRFVSETYNALR